MLTERAPPAVPSEDFDFRGNRCLAVNPTLKVTLSPTVPT